VPRFLAHVQTSVRSSEPITERALLVRLLPMGDPERGHPRERLH
jgi:hypothetical protein